MNVKASNGSGRAFKALQAQLTNRGDGFEIGIETHQQRVVVQSHGGHQEVEAENRLTDLAAGLAQVDRPLPQICRGGERGQGVELGFQLAGFIWMG